MANAAFVGGRRIVAASNGRRTAGGHGAPRRSRRVNRFQLVTLQPRSRSPNESNRCVSSTQSTRASPLLPPFDASTDPPEHGPSFAVLSRHAAAPFSMASRPASALFAAAAPARSSRSTTATSSRSHRPLSSWADAGPMLRTENTQCSSRPAARQPSAAGSPARAVHAAFTADLSQFFSIPAEGPHRSAASQSAARSSSVGFWTRTVASPSFPFCAARCFASFSISFRPFVTHDLSPWLISGITALAPPPSARCAATNCAAARGDSSWNAGPASDAADMNRRTSPSSTACSASEAVESEASLTSINFDAAHDAFAVTRASTFPFSHLPTLSDRELATCTAAARAGPCASVPSERIDAIAHSAMDASPTSDVSIHTADDKTFTVSGLNPHRILAQPHSAFAASRALHASFSVPLRAFISALVAAWPASASTPPGTEWRVASAHKALETPRASNASARSDTLEATPEAARVSSRRTAVSAPHSAPPSAPARSFAADHSATDASSASTAAIDL